MSASLGQQTGTGDMANFFITFAGALPTGTVIGTWLKMTEIGKTGWAEITDIDGLIVTYADPNVCFAEVMTSNPYVFDFYTDGPVIGSIFPAEANVEVAETAYGPTGAEYAGELNLAVAEAAAAAAQLVTDKAEVDAEKANIKTGTTILTKAGSYPTTETSKAEQLVADKAAVLSHAADIRDGTTVLEQEGSLDLPAESNVSSGVKFDNETKTGTLTNEIASQRICDAIRESKSNSVAVRL